MADAAVWITREGEQVPVRDMRDGHLSAAIALVRRRGAVSARRIAYRRAFQAMAYAEDAPDGAAMAAEAEALDLLAGEYNDAILGENIPLFAALLSEAKARKETKCRK
jgi:hypothetical protein